MQRISHALWPDRALGPLTFTQEQLWWHHQAIDARELLNLSYSILIEGQLDQAILQESLSLLVRRHEPLRTVYVEQQGQPKAVIHDSWDSEIHTIDLSGTIDSERWAYLTKLAQTESGGAFDLAHDSPVRVKSVIISQDLCLILLTLHHISADAWGMRVLCRDWSMLYSWLRRYKSGKTTPDLPTIQSQCVDAALAQRRWLASESARQQMAYWRQRFATCEIPDRELPCDFQRLPVPYLRTSRQVVEISAPVEMALLQIKSETQFSEFIVLLAAFVIVLQQMGGGDLPVGTLFANRRLREAEECLGAFYNPSPLIVPVNNSRNCWEHLEVCAEKCFEAFENQELPFGVTSFIFHEVTGRSPEVLTRVMFYVDEYPAERLLFEGTTARGIHLDAQTGYGVSVSGERRQYTSGAESKNTDKAAVFRTASDADLSFFIRQGSCSKTLSVFYKTDLFKDETIAWMTDCFFGTLIQIAEDGNRQVDDLIMPTRASSV